MYIYIHLYDLPLILYLCHLDSLKLVIHYLSQRSETRRGPLRMYENRALLIAFGFLIGYVYCNEELWCHHCNVDLNDGRKGECNDPYIAGGVANLKACPRNEEYHCIKGIVYYKNTRTTVRGCVPSRNIRDYCSNETFPEASVECHFCKEYGCNGSSVKFEKSLCSFVTWILIALRIFQYNQ